MFLETAMAVFILGWLVGFACVWLLTVRPLERQIRDMHRNETRELRMRLYRSHVRRQHLGTPYLASTVRQATVPEVVSTGRPGLRVVKGEMLYSAEWLNDDRRVNA